MCRNVLFAVLLPVFCWAVLCPPCQAGKSGRSVEALVADLKKGDQERFKALQELEALGEKAAEAVPALIELLPNKNEDVRLQATLVLGKIGAAAVEPLSKALDSKDADVRFYAVWGLAFVGPPARSATPAVLKALGDTSAQVRRKAAYTLGRIDPEPETVAGPLVTALGDADGDVRQAAEASLPKLGKAAVPVLIKVLQGDNAKLRNTAIKTLGDIGAEAAAAIPELQTHLLQPDKGAAEVAASALAGIGAPALPTLTSAAVDENQLVRSLALGALQRIGAPAVPSLVDLLGAKHLDVRRQSAALLGQIPVQDKSVVIGLGFATRDKDYEVRRNALQSLRNMGSAAKLAEPYVSVLLVDFDPQIRMMAFETLQNLGVDARPGLKKALSHTDPIVRITTASLMTQLNLEVALAEPILLEGLKEKDQALKTQAAHALSIRGLQPDVVLPIFIASLKAELPSVRRQAAESIVRYGTKAKQAAPALIEALDDSDNGVRAQALTTLRQIGAEPKSLFAAMIKLLRGNDTAVHGQAAQIVFQVGPEAVGDIVALLKKKDAPALRLVCLQTLAMVGPPAKEAVPELLQALGDPAPRARMTAARALGNIGPDAKAALAALEKATQDDDANVKQVALAAVVQIRADPNQKEFQVHGVLTAGDPLDRVRPQMFHVVHTYPMKKGTSYTIDLNSPWDNFLRLENAAGQQLAADDDSGGMLNARITFQAPEDGWYRIIVTSYAAGASGNYTLKVR